MGFWLYTYQRKVQQLRGRLMLKRMRGSCVALVWFALCIFIIFIDKAMSNEKDKEAIAHPTLELYWQILSRGASAGYVLAVLFSPPDGDNETSRVRLSHSQSYGVVSV